jgi:hypothetical protein
MPITNGVVQGDKLTFKVATANSGTRQFTGHVIDGSITGQVTYGASQQHAWKAKRVSQAVAGL